MVKPVVKSGRMNEIRSVASLPVIMIGITASMGGFLFGADTGQISGFLIMEVCKMNLYLSFLIIPVRGILADNATRIGLPPNASRNLTAKRKHRASLTNSLMPVKV